MPSGEINEEAFWKGASPEARGRYRNLVVAGQGAYSIVARAVEASWTPPAPAARRSLRSGPRARSRRHPARSPRAQRAHCGLQPAARPRCSASVPAATRCRRQRRSPFPCARLACAQVSSGETVAIKRIAEVFYDAHEAKKVLREIRLLRDFRHPHTH